jgi:hypothetical protein
MSCTLFSRIFEQASEREKERGRGRQGQRSVLFNEAVLLLKSYNVGGG